jgi:hypothetical protein
LGATAGQHVGVISSTKRTATAKARLALRGVVLTQIDGDDCRPRWIATQGALTRSFDDLVELERWVDLVDGKHGHAA